MKYKTGYQVDGWGRFICEIQIRENPRKAGHYPCSASTIFERPPKTKKYESAVWNKETKEWTLVPDFMGHEFYNKKTAEKYDKKIELGDIIDLKQWTEEKPDGRFIWQYYNDLTNKWEENTVRKAEIERLKKCTRLIAESYQQDLQAECSVEIES